MDWMDLDSTNPTILFGPPPSVPWQDEGNRYEARRSWDEHVLQQNTWCLIVWRMWTHEKHRRKLENLYGGTLCLFDNLVHSFVWVLEIAVTSGGFLREEWFCRGLGICLERLGCLALRWGWWCLELSCWCDVDKSWSIFGIPAVKNERCAFLPTRTKRNLKGKCLEFFGIVKCMVAEHVAILFFLNRCLTGAELVDGSQLWKERIA